MTLDQQIDRRLSLAEQVGCRPRRWIATAAVAATIADADTLRGLPVTVGSPRSEWGLELVCERVC